MVNLQSSYVFSGDGVVRILNIMLGKGLGGIEQASIDYTQALAMQGHETCLVLHPKAAIKIAAIKKGVRVAEVSCLGPWDPMTPARIKKIQQEFAADIVITHGNRAVMMAKKSLSGIVPIVAVAHNYLHQHLHGADAVFAITQHMADTILQKKQVTRQVYVMPNMVNLEGRGGVKRTWANPPVIGTLGRFVPKKGFDIYLQALAQLRERGYVFRAVLGGAGDEENNLHALAEKLKLGDCLQFTGWVHDPIAYMKDIDVFCLPSLHEPFGIVLLEAMSVKLPVVATDSEGPREIITHQTDGILVVKGDANALADGLAYILDDEYRSREIAGEAYRMLKSRYTMDRVGGHMSAILGEVYQAFHNKQPLKKVS